MSLVRVKDPATKHEYTTTAELAKERGYTVLNKPAVDRDGAPLPPKMHVDIPKTPAVKSAGKAADQAATDTK